MSYELIYHSDVEENLARLPVHVQTLALENLGRLADDPVSASNPPSSPLWPARQLFVLDVDDGIDRYVFHVVWRYHEDEKSLRVLAMANWIIPRNQDDPKD